MKPPALSRRPQATTFRIEDLVDMARRGEVRIPRFQRPFRWEQEDIIKLLDSVYHGYPIGTLLLWKRAAEAERLRFGPVEIDAPKIPEAHYVVDGQQRLTALVGVLLSMKDEPADPWTLYFDLEAAAAEPGPFVPKPRRGGVPASFVPMNVVLDSERLLAWLDTYPGRAQHPLHVTLAHQLSKRIQQFQVPAYIVDAEESTVRVIFDRMNSTGKALKKQEVFQALHGDLQKDQPQSLEMLVTDLRKEGFGDLDRDWALKALLAVAGRDVSRDFRRELDRVPDLGEAFSATERALRATLIFLKRDAGIPHLRVLPYHFPLLPLARFFSLYASAQPRSRDLLSRWLWRGAVTGAHQTITFARTALATMAKPRAEELVVQELLAQLPPRAQTEGSGEQLSLRDVNVRAATTKVLVNVLASLHPADLTTGRELDLSGLFAADRPYLPALFAGARSNLANRILHPPLDPERARACLVLMEGDAALRSHGISAAALAALRCGDEVGFLRIREETLAEEIKRFVLARTRSEDADRPSLRWLLAEGSE